MPEIIHLYKNYGDKPVIKNLSINIPDNGFISFCGESGCGKSTLLKIIAGIEKANSGCVLFEKSNPVISMSFQEPRLLPNRTAAENVNFVLGDKKATLAVAKALLDELDITDHNLYPDELSGGMKARASIARTLAIEADIYIFDEAFANLDEKSALLAADVIKAHTKGKLVLSIIHDEKFARLISDQTVRFQNQPLSEYSII